MKRTQIRKIWLAAVVAVLNAVPTPRGASAQTVYGTSEQPLEGRRYETMRALAHYLDEAAQDALAGAIEARRRGTLAERRYISAVRDFARRAEGFHQRMDDYEAESFDVTDDVDYLIARARRVSQQVRQIRAYESTYDDWNNVVDVLNRMRRLLNGEDVEVPPAHDEYGDYDRDYGYLRRGGGTVRSGETYGGTDAGSPLKGQRLQQFRELAHQLDVNARRALQAAERDTPNSDRARGVMADLRHFADQARSLHDRSDANEVAPRDMGPIVEHLLEDARQADRSMRDARVFSGAWDEWARTIEVLNQMADLLR